MENHKNIDKAKQIINKIINSMGFCIIIGILILLKTFLFYNATIAIDEPLEPITIVGTLSFIIVIVCFLCILPNRARIITTFAVDIILSVLLFADNIYYIYSNSFLSVAQISNIQYGEEIMATLPMMLEIKQIWYFIDIILIVILVLSKVIKLEKQEKNTKKELIAKGIIGIIGIVIFCIIGTSYIEKGNKLSYNKDMQMREATVFGYHIYDIENAINIKNNTKYKEFQKLLNTYSFFHLIKCMLNFFYY